MGNAIGGLLGLNGGASGTGFSGPNMASIDTPVTADQANEQYKNSQQGLQQQQDFLKALQAQNGIQNQSQVFNQLQDVAAGQGPNPAQAQLAQATGANVANQAALMAGQRGAGANVGLMARQAAHQGAQTQQQAAGQGAALQAQQSMNALGAMGSLANQQVAQQAAATGGYSQSAQNEQANLLNSINAQNSANIQRNANVNNINGQLAGINMQGQQNFMGGLMNGFGMLSSMAEGGEVPDSSIQPDTKPDTPELPAASLQMSTPSPEEHIPSAVGVQGPGNIDIGSANIPTIQNAFQGGGGGGGGGGMGGLMALLAEGGRVAVQGPGNIDIGSASIPTIQNAFKPSDSKDSSKGPMSDLGKAIGKNLTSFSGSIGGFAEGGKVPAMVSPGEQYLDKNDIKKVKEGKNPLSVGERIPGKPKHPGNDYRNDTVPKNLEAGGIVIPNKVMQSKNPPKEAQRFIAAVMAHSGKGMQGKKK